MQPDGEWLPVFAGQREPFAAGNTAAVRHGLRAVKLYDERAAEIRAELEADDPRLCAYPEATAMYARHEAQLERADEWLAANGPFTDEGDVSGGAVWWLRNTERARKLLVEMGRTPASAARVWRNQAAAAAELASVADVGRRGREQAGAAAGSSRGVDGPSAGGDAALAAPLVAAPAGGVS